MPNDGAFPGLQAYKVVPRSPVLSIRTPIAGPSGANRWLDDDGENQRH